MFFVRRCKSPRKRQGPRGPVGPASPPGYNGGRPGDTGPCGPSGSGNLSPCSYKDKKKGKFPVCSGKLSSITVTATETKVGIPTFIV